MGNEDHRLGAPRRERWRLSHVVLRLSSPKLRQWVPWAIGAGFLTSSALGFIGWMSIAAETEGTLPSGDPDIPTAIHRTVALFAADAGGLGPAPWTLATARLLAPLMVASSTLAVVVAFLGGWAERAAARTTSSHVVVVGNPERASRHIGPRERAVRTTVVHVVDDEDQAARCGHSHVHTVRSLDWPNDASARSSHSIVIASGNDTTNLQLLGDVIEGLRTLPDDGAPPEIRVEIDDAPWAAWLAIACAAEDTPVLIDVICPTRDRAEQLARELVPHGSDPDETCWALLGWCGDEEPTFRAVADRVSVLGKWTGRQIPLHLVRSATPGPPGSQLSIAPPPASEAVELREHPDIDSLLDEVGTGSRLQAATIGGVPGAGIRSALELVARHSGATVWVPEGIGAPPLPSLRTLRDPCAEVPDGLWTRAARIWMSSVEGNADRGVASPTPAHVAAIQAAAAALVRDHGCRLEPARGRSGAPVLPKEISDEIHERGLLPGAAPEPAQVDRLPEALRHAGIAVHVPEPL